MMIFGTFPERSIASWKARRDELAVHVQDAEHTGEGVHLATSAIADQLVRCECAVKKLEANLDKLRKVAQGLVLNQPSIPQHCYLSERKKPPPEWETIDMMNDDSGTEGLENQRGGQGGGGQGGGGQGRGGEGGGGEGASNGGAVGGGGMELVDLTTCDAVTLGYAIADLASRSEIEDRQKNRLRSIIESKSETTTGVTTTTPATTTGAATTLPPTTTLAGGITLADVCLVWITVICMLGDYDEGSRRRSGTCAVARVFFDLIRNKRQSPAVLTSIFTNLSKDDSLGLLKLQQEAQLTFGLIQDSKYPNSWLAITLIDELAHRYILAKLTSATQRFREESWHLSDDKLQEFCAKWIDETELEFRSKTLLQPNRQDLIELLLQFLVKIKISALSLYRCAVNCSKETTSGIVTPVLLSTCSESMIDTVEARTENCQSVTELYSIFLRLFCAAASECDDRSWLVLVAAGAAMFYSRLITMCLPARLNLAIYAAGFVSVALESLPKGARESVESSRQVADALMSLSQAQPGGFRDTSEEVAQKLLHMCGVSSRILGRDRAVEEAERNPAAFPVEEFPVEQVAVKEEVKKMDEGIIIMSDGRNVLGRPRKLAEQSSPLPEILLNRSILDLAQGEASPLTTTAAPAPYENEAMAASSPVLTTRFSFDNLLGGGAGGSRETSVAAFVGKWAAWGRRS